MATARSVGLPGKIYPGDLHLSPTFSQAKPMIQTTLTQCSYAKPGGDSHGCFNEQSFTTDTIEEALKRLEDYYGIIPPRRPRGVFRDLPEGKTRQVGFMHHRWQEIYDRSPGKTRHYWEENWISFDKVDISPIQLPKHLLARE